jgi:hypothetical protein
VDFQRALESEILSAANKGRDTKFTPDDMLGAMLDIMTTISAGERVALLDKGRSFGASFTYPAYVSALGLIRRSKEILAIAIENGVLDVDYVIGDDDELDAVHAAEIREMGWSPYYSVRRKAGKHSGGWVDEHSPSPDKIKATLAAIAAFDGKEQSK